MNEKNGFNGNDENVNLEKPYQGEHVPFGGMVHEKKKHKIIYFSLLVLGLIILVMGYFLITGKRGSGSAKSPKIRQMQELVTEINTLESDIQTKQKEIFGLISAYKKKSGEDLLSVNLLNLTESEQKLLEKKINEEMDVSIKSLLNDILDQNNEINDLKKKVKRKEALLPKPHIVARGENHYKISMNYLLQHQGIGKEKAMKLVERAALFEFLIPGFKVWNFYSADEFGTFITQGTAPISPNKVQRRAKKKITDERDKAVSERDSLSGEIEILEAKRNELISQLDFLNQEKIGLISKIGDLNKKNLEMQTDLNSLFYCLDLKRNLKKKGIIKFGFLSSPKLKKFPSELFKESIDLRSETEINVAASGFNLKKIRNLVLFPRFYKKGVDYNIKINIQNKSAVLTIIKPEKLKNEKVVISVE